MSNETTEKSGVSVASSRQIPLWRRLGWTIGLMTLIIGSLLTFPSGVPWLVLVWLFAYVWAAQRGWQAWLFPLGCVLILVFKRPYWPESLLVVGCLLAVTAVVEAAAGMRKAKPPGGLRVGLLVILALSWCWALVQWRCIAHGTQPLALGPGRPLVCIGDSLTSGVAPYGGYPQELQRFVPVPVINLGQPGITSHDALKLLPELKAANPQVVVIELGGHDFLRGRPRAETMADLETLIEASQSAGARVILMEVPRGFMTDPYHGLERELAGRYDLELVSDSAIRNLVLWSPFAPPGMWVGGPYLSDDGLHPNDHGNRYLARRISVILEGLVSTNNADGTPNLSPMGPLVDETISQLVLRPYRTSTTYANLKRHGEGVLHVTDDVEMIARAAVGRLDPLPDLKPARVVQGFVVADACRWYEFRVTSIEDRAERTTIAGQVVGQGRIRDFFGFNRAKHAVLEAAILATRLHLLPPEEVQEEFRRLAVLVEKTGGAQERRAFEFLNDFVSRSDGKA